MSIDSDQQPPIVNDICYLIFSQFSTTHCVCVQALGLSIYVVSCYFQYSDEIEDYLRRLEKVFHSLRDERLIGGRCQRAIVALEFP